MEINSQFSNTKILLERFADFNKIGSKKSEFRVYALEKNKDGVFSNSQIGVSYPNPFAAGDSFFVAEVKILLTPKGGFMVYNHIFQFEPGALEAELLKIDLELAKTLAFPTRIAKALNVCYYQIAPYMKDYNDKNDVLGEIAQILNNFRGTSAAVDFGI